jgi:hypothetical protein
VEKQDSQRADQDRRALEVMKKARADISQARNIKHYFYFSSRRAGELAAARLRLDGYAVTIGRAPNGAAWGVYACSTSVIDDEALDDLYERFSALADEPSGEYDGWDAATQPW